MPHDTLTYKNKNLSRERKKGERVPGSQVIITSYHNIVENANNHRKWHNEELLDSSCHVTHNKKGKFTAKES